MPLFKRTLSQQDLIKGCLSNDRRSQELLYKEYCQAMLSICMAYTKSEQDAVEVLQDGFLKIFQQIQKFDPSISSLYTWMRTVMVRTAIDFLRKDQREPQRIEFEETAHDQTDEAEVIKRMNSEEILILVRKLPETTRAVFNLFVSEGCSHKEIAEILNINEGTSRWHLSEARKHLMGQLKNKKTA